MNESPPKRACHPLWFNCQFLTIWQPLDPTKPGSLIFENHQSRSHVLDPYPSVLLGKRREPPNTGKYNLPNELGTNNCATIKRSLLKTERISNNPMTWAGKEDGTSCKELHQSPGCTLYSWCYAKKTVVWKTMVQQSSIFSFFPTQNDSWNCGGAKVFASSWEFKTYLSKTTY